MRQTTIDVPLKRNFLLTQLEKQVVLLSTNQRLKLWAICPKEVILTFNMTTKLNFY